MVEDTSGYTNNTGVYKLTTTFTATTDSVNIQFKNKILNDINAATGGNFSLKNTTVKGPIEYLTEPQPIKSGVNCGKSDLVLRWKNDLGGWEQWRYPRFRTFKENVSNKEVIKRDITENWDNTFINSDTEYDVISVNARGGITVRSELLTENEKQILEQSKRSVRMQAFLDGRWVTVIPQGNSYTHYDEEEKIREVSFDILLPDTIIQEQ